LINSIFFQEVGFHSNKRYTVTSYIFNDRTKNVHEVYKMLLSKKHFIKFNFIQLKL